MRPSTLNSATLRLSSNLTAFAPPSGISARLATFMNSAFCESIVAPWQGPEPLSGIGEKHDQATIRSSRERSIGDTHWHLLKSPTRSSPGSPVSNDAPTGPGAQHKLDPSDCQSCQDLLFVVRPQIVFFTDAGWLRDRPELQSLSWFSEVVVALCRRGLGATVA